MNQSSGIGFLGMLAIVFIALKLGEVGVVAGWSWVWVLSPLWLPLAVVLAILVICAPIVAIKKAWRR